MIRRAAKINEGHEEGIFKPIGWEEFSTKTARLESIPQLGSESQPVLELLREALELKKLNNNFMKITMFEDLIADLYARLYEINIVYLVEQVTDENKEKMKVDHLLMGVDGTQEPSTPASAVPASDTPAPRGRTKGIARRDIQKRADTIVNTKLAPRLPASKMAAAETEQAATSQGVGSTPSGPGSAARESNKAGLPNGDATADQAEERDGDDTESDIEETKLEEGTSALFPHVTDDAEEAGSGDEGAGNGNEGDGEGGDENEGEEEEGDEGDEEEMQDEETRMEEDEDKDGADQSGNETETEPVNGNSEGLDHDAMEIMPADA